MKKLFFILYLLLATYSFGDQYAVVSNKSMKELSLSQIKAIFLKKISFVENLKVIPVNLKPGNELRSKFEKQILQMNFSRLKTYWSKQHYLGRRPPISMQSQESVKAFVKEVDGALGYIREKDVDKNLNIIYRWND